MLGDLLPLILEAHLHLQLWWAATACLVMHCLAVTRLLNWSTPCKRRWVHSHLQPPLAHQHQRPLQAVVVQVGGHRFLHSQSALCW